MREVMISIQPKWVEKIVSGKKTVEVRKTRPKCETPFKCYIYETLGKTKWYNTCKDDCERPYPNCACHEGWGKVIGEFVCDRVYDLKCLPNEYSGKPVGTYEQFICENSCLSFDDIKAYGKGTSIYGWHISNLVIYDKPRELWEFKTICKEYGSDNPNCTECHYYIDGMCYEYEESDCGCNGRKPITRAPQSWQFCVATEPRQTAD